MPGPGLAKCPGPGEGRECHSGARVADGRRCQDCRGRAKRIAEGEAVKRAGWIGTCRETPHGRRRDVPTRGSAGRLAKAGRSARRIATATAETPTAVGVGGHPQPRSSKTGELTASGHAHTIRAVLPARSQ